MRIKVELVGCDDVTEVILDVNESELIFLQGLAEKTIEASEYSGQPAMEIEIFDKY